MPSVLSDSDKETVRRTVPKSANKIQAVAVARLYIAYPNKQRWLYTGLQGAAVLANDLVGNTFWIKMGSNRGVLWDQEVYDPFYYNQDRTFFHSFELEGCLAGLSFVDEKEARQFKKKMDEREKNASKSTKATPFQGLGPQAPAIVQPNGKTQSRFGGLSGLLHGQRSSSAPHVSQPPPPLPPPPSLPPPRESPSLGRSSPSKDQQFSLDDVDPSILDELLEMGITADTIEDNLDFIKIYIEQKKAAEAADGTEDGVSDGVHDDRRTKAPPPPPPTAPPMRVRSISPQHTGGTSISRRGPPPAPPPSRRSRPDSQRLSSTQHESPPESPQRTPSPPRSKFRAPPPIADAGKFAHMTGPALPTRPRASSNLANPGPPPPPRPPKTPMDDEIEPRSKFGVPPPFQGERMPSAAPPPPPARSNQPASPKPPPRDNFHTHAVPPATIAPPPLPPKTPNSAGPSSSGPPPPPPLPHQRNSTSAPPAPPLPTNPRPVPTVPSSSGPPPPPPPPLPSLGAPPPPPLPPSSSRGPLPPPMPSSGGPPPPPLPPGRDTPNAPPLPKPSGGTEDMLASIRASGGIGGGNLKKVSESEKRDRSAAAVPGAAPSASSGGANAPAAPSGGGGLADALAAALSQRNKKVSASGE
ncbi:MAG: hypothetical protein Q9202_002765 [Teloschistes flavicans]